MIIDAPILQRTTPSDSDSLYFSRSPSTWTMEVPAYGLLPWQMQVIHKIIKLSQIQENWDSYNGKPPAPKAINTAIELIEALPFENEDMPIPSVVPTSEGGLQIEWSGEERELEVEIRPSGPIEIFACQD